MQHELETPALPEAFIQEMAPLLQEGLSAFLASYDEPYVRGLRVNPLKTVYLPESETDGAVPWEETGFYLKNESLLGASVLHEAGAYYIQEPSAMAAVKALDPQPGEIVLDLCAAPGGKSTQIAGRLMGQGLLVANEPVNTRAPILARNLERMGVKNAISVSAMPDRLSAVWPEAFDAVLVDAPCSGEGMFRRHPETRLEWNAASPAGCAGRQTEILNEAAKMVRPGGRITYSTCTLNTLEDESVISAFLASHPDFEPLMFQLSGVMDAPDYQTRLWPHKIRGEGHFVACLHKKGAGKANGFVLLPVPERTVLASWQDFCKATLIKSEAPECTGMFGTKLVYAPLALPVKGLRVLRMGLPLGEMKGKVFQPDHSLALALPPHAFARCVTLDEVQAKAYQHGETIPTDCAPGWCAACYGGLVLGWGKVSDGQMKNHYPKGLRR